MTDSAHSYPVPALSEQQSSPDVAMAQVRDLLFGDAQRRLVDRINHLEDRLRETDRRLAQHAAEADRRMRELDARGEERRRRTLADISANLAQMSQDLRRLAESGEAESSAQDGEAHG